MHTHKKEEEAFQMQSNEFISCANDTQKNLIKEPSLLHLTQYSVVLFNIISVIQTKPKWPFGRLS